MVYIGIESGNDELLKKMGKHQTAEDTIAAFHKCFRAGITPSGTIILGLAGKNKDLSLQHIKDTAELVNRASPVHSVSGRSLPIWYISCLALMSVPGTPMQKDILEGKLIPMDADDILYEMKILMENISDDVKNCVYRSNHASNYLALSGKLSRDREKILTIIEQNLLDKKQIRPERYRAL